MRVSRDTHPSVAAVMLDRQRALSVAERLAHVSAMSLAVQRLALAGIRERHPQASARELRLRLASLRLDPQIMQEVFGWDVAERGRG